jgi:RsmE family RNA methyltransferase
LAPPQIAAPVKLRDLSSAGVSPAGRPEAGGTVCRIVLAESEDDRLLRDALQVLSREAILAVGPEGGWTDDELQWFRESGWIAASLGDTILRAETAAIVATAFALDALR